MLICLCFQTNRNETIDVTYPNKEIFDDGVTAVEIVYKPTQTRFEIVSRTCPWALFYYNGLQYEWMEFLTMKTGTGMCFA